MKSGAEVTDYRGHPKVKVDEEGAHCISCCDASSATLVDLPAAKGFVPAAEASGRPLATPKPDELMS